MSVEIARRLAVNSSSRLSSSEDEAAVCVQASFGNIDRRRLVEWFEMQRLLGVSSIGVYSTPLTHPDTHRTLTQYARTPHVQHRTIDYLDVNGKGHLLTVNLAAINDCLYRHMYTHRFIAVIDFDEVYLPSVTISQNAKPLTFPWSMITSLVSLSCSGVCHTTVVAQHIAMWRL